MTPSANRATHRRLLSRLVVISGLALALSALSGCDLLRPAAQPSASAAGSATATASPTPTTTPLGPLTGKWEGTWMNTGPIQAVGTFTLVWAQQGSRLFGALTVTGSDCLRSGNVTGTVFGPRLRFGAVEGPVTVEYDGTIVDADTIQGTYRSECGNSEGTWAATLVGP